MKSVARGDTSVGIANAAFDHALNCQQPMPIMLTNHVKTLLRYTIRAGNRLVIVPLLWTAYKVFNFKIYFLITARIAHLAWNTTVFNYRLTHPEEGGRRERYILFGGEPCNRQLYAMWHRILPIIDSRLASFWLNSDIRFLLGTPFVGYVPYLVREFKEADQAPALRFTDEEMARGRDLRAGLGLADEDWFVCFQARDDTYHSKVRSDTGEEEGRTVAVRSHRNADIRTYMEAAEAITEAGGFAIRVGWGVSTRLETTNKRIIDYSNLARSDFGDIYLLGSARFFIASGAGLVAVPPLFKVPVLFTNILPTRIWPIGKQSLMMPKLLRDRTTGELVPFSTLGRHGLMSYERAAMTKWDKPASYAALDLVPVDNEPADLAAGCRDMMNQLEGVPVDPEIREVQLEYARRYFSDLPGALQYGPLLAPSFAAKFKDVILG
jgi:putative glycosyltransferase (TIGR04372 family)